MNRFFPSTSLHEYSSVQPKYHKPSSLTSFDESTTPRSISIGSNSKETHHLQSHQQLPSQQPTHNQQQLAHSTSKIMLTQRDEEVVDDSPTLLNQQQLKEHYKSSFQPISIQSISSLEANLRSTPVQSNSVSRATTNDGQSRNHIYICDPTTMKTTKHSSTPQPQDDDLYSVGFVGQQLLTTGAQSRNKEVYSQQSPYVSILPQTSSSIPKPINSTKSTGATSHQRSFSISSSINNTKDALESISINNPTIPQQNPVEQSLSEVIAALAKLQTCLVPVIKKEQSQQNQIDTTEVQELRFKVEEQDRLLSRSEQEKADLQAKLNLFAQKMSALIGQPAAASVSPILLIGTLEDTLAKKDRRIAELETQVKCNFEEKEREINSLRKQLDSQQKSETGPVNKANPIASYSLNSSPAVKVKYPKPNPLGPSVMTNLTGYSIGIKENEFPTSVSSSSGYNVFKARIDQLNSLRDDRFTTSLRK